MNKLSPRITLLQGRVFWQFEDGTILPLVAGGADAPAEPDQTLNELNERLGRLSELSDEEIAQLEADMISMADEIDVTSLTDEELATLNALAENVEAVRNEAASRIEAANARANEAAEALARLRPTDETPEGDTPETEGEQEEETEGETEAEQAPPVEPVVETPEAVAASTAPVRRLVPALPSRVPARNQPRVREERMSLVAAADIQSVPAGTHADSLTQVAEWIIKRRHSMGKVQSGFSENVVVASVEADFPDDRMLTPDNLFLNQQRIEQVASPQAVVAALISDTPNVLCAPLSPYYDLMTVGSNVRPVRDSLVPFQADRGGIVHLTPPTIADLSGAIDIWTQAVDVNPQSNTKNCLAVDCGDQHSALTQAITRCLEFSNFGARTFPEQVRAWLDLSLTAHARTAERALLDGMAGFAANLSATQVLGAARDFLGHIDRAATSIRFRHRMDPGQPVHVTYPAWFDSMMREDIARQIPGDGPESLALAEARINTWFAARNINVTRHIDSESGVTPFAPPGGQLQGWPTTVKWYIYPEGSFLFLDGGTLDLGLVRDSVLNSTNKYQIFAETFEGLAFVGPEAWEVTSHVCASGQTAATEDMTAFCTGGS